MNEAAERTSSDAALRGLFGRDSLYMFLWAIQIILASLLTPIETRLLGPSKFGLVATSVAIMQLLVAIGSFSLQTAIQRAYARPDGEAEARRLVALALAVAAVTLGAAYATGPLWCRAIGLGDFSAPVRYAVIWAGLTAVTNATFGLLRSRDQLGWFATVSLLQSVLAEAVALGLLVFVHRTAAAYLFGQMVCQGLAVIVGLYVARPLLPGRRDLPMLTDALRYTAALVPAAVGAFVFDTCDRLVIHGDLGPGAVARYAVARNIGGLAIVLLWVLQSVWMPRLFALKDLAVRRVVLAGSRDGIYMLAACFATTITLASPVLLTIWVPSSFRPAGLVLITGLIACSAVPVAGGQSSVRVLLVCDRSGPVAVATVIGALVNLALNLALVPVLGIDGSALVTLFSYGLVLALVRWRAQLALPLPLPSLELFGIVAICVAIGLGSTALPWNFATIAARLLLALIAGVVFLVQFISMVAPERLAPLNARLPWLTVVVPKRVADTIDLSVSS